MNACNAVLASIISVSGTFGLITGINMLENRDFATKETTDTKVQKRLEKAKNPRDLVGKSFTIQEGQDGGLQSIFISKANPWCAKYQVLKILPNGKIYHGRMRETCLGDEPGLN